MINMFKGEYDSKLRNNKSMISYNFSNNNKNKQEIINIDLYSDGACSGNPGPGGFCSIIVSDKLGITNDKSIAFCGGDKDTTNNKMELQGIYEGLKSILELCNRESNIYKFVNELGCFNKEAISSLDPLKLSITIHTDSMYAINSLTKWCYAWFKNNWMNSKGELVKNREILEAISQLIHHQFGEIQFKYVKGHSNNKYNNKCDELAVDVYKSEKFNGTNMLIVDLESI